MRRIFSVLLAMLVLAGCRREIQAQKWRARSEVEFRDVIPPTVEISGQWYGDWYDAERGRPEKFVLNLEQNSNAVGGRAAFFDGPMAGAVFTRAGVTGQVSGSRVNLLLKPDQPRLYETSWLGDATTSGIAGTWYLHGSAPRGHDTEGPWTARFLTRNRADVTAMDVAAGTGTVEAASNVRVFAITPHNYGGTWHDWMPDKYQGSWHYWDQRGEFLDAPLSLFSYSRATLDALETNKPDPNVTVTLFISEHAFQGHDARLIWTPPNNAYEIPNCYSSEVFTTVGWLWDSAPLFSTQSPPKEIYVKIEVARDPGKKR